MYLDEAMIEGVEERYGRPEVVRLEQEISPLEIALVRGSQKHGRAHDITLFIFKGSQVALIRKPMHPPDVFRAPSGGLAPGEPFEEGAKREAWEETGLEIEIEQYLLRLLVRFTCEDDELHWTSHIFSAKAVGGELNPQDRKEISESRWATLEELQGPIREALLSSGWGLLAYRAILTDLAIEALRKNHSHLRREVDG